MTDTMKERIARGQAEFDGRGWLHMHSADRKRYLQRVDLFLAAMREPDEDMLHSGGDVSTDWVDAKSVWQAMIDAAISEGKE